MARKRYKPEEIVAKLRQVDVLVSQGQNMGDAGQGAKNARNSPPARRRGMLSGGRGRCGPLALRLGAGGTMGRVTRQSVVTNVSRVSWRCLMHPGPLEASMII